MEPQRFQQKDDYAFFKENLKALYAKYPGKYLVIKDRRVDGVHDSFDLAVIDALKKHDMGTFIVQHCTEAIEALNFVNANVKFCEA